MRVNRKISFTIAAGALALVGACGGSSDSMAGYKAMSQPTPTATMTGEQPSPTFNDADVMFAQMMILHHEQAIEMAELASAQASDAEIKDLASKIKESQEQEIQTMEGWLSEWGKPTPSPGMGHEMPGAMSEEDMQKLESAQGKDFDRLFAKQMIAHHQGAIKMARMEEAGGANPQARELAKTIVTTQQEEVTQLRQILDRL
ncbi:DUF305 domain-containing protein [Nonomuraea turkmeniaca]|uniref:DUF305 domain-containing protein n=1 Tax=Nonomuraea turkmeniaca TaxID=103838 RepID=A0A5S4FAT2_9ACTN|nr:DUF305 domain-containing protein [Nonomuraea turkmeniaca]TMR14367.1 DUF305 domain-containing protein [Nonomuraea turkmeniaca]